MRRLILVFAGLLLAGSALDAWTQTATAPGQPRRIYLDEFRPTSELKAPAHLLTRAKFPCVNVHTHPGRLTDEQIDDMVRVMDEANIAVSVSLDGQAGRRFDEHLARLNMRHPGRFAVFVRMDYQGTGQDDKPETWDVNRPGFGLRMADKLSDAVRRGATGLKLLKTLGLYLRDPQGKLLQPDDPRFDPVWQRAGELGVPVLWHCADPVAFFSETSPENERWEELYRHPEWSFHGKDFPPHQDLIDARNRVIARHPKTTFICAHMADIPEDLAKLAGYLDRWPNMNVEIAARVAELGRQPYTARRFFLKYADRILFGTDGVPPMSELIPHWRFLETYDEYFPYEDNPFPPQGLWNIYGLGLPDDVLRKVYCENAVRLIPAVRGDAGSGVRAVNTALQQLTPLPAWRHNGHGLLLRVALAACLPVSLTARSRSPGNSGCSQSARLSRTRLLFRLCRPTPSGVPRVACPPPVSSRLAGQSVA